MNEADFERFINLIELDQEYYNLNSERVLLQNEIEQRHKDIEVIQNELHLAHENIVDLRKKKDLLELESKALDQEEYKKREKLDNASTTKEYYSLEKEIQDLKRKKEQLEPSVLSLWQDLEKLEKSYQELEEQLHLKISEIEKDIENFKNRRENLDIQINENLQKRRSIENEVDPELLSQYNSMKEAVNNPVVPLINESCSVCHLNVTAQDFSEIKRQKLIKCKDCFRLLYLPIGKTLVS